MYTKMKVIVTVLAVLVLTSKFVESIECPDGWLSFHDSCYFFEDNQNMDWTEATHFCAVFHSSHLVTIESGEEEVFLKNQANHLFKTGAHNVWFWVGANDLQIEGVWRWYTNDKLLSAGWNHWYPGQPQNRHGEDCGLLWGDYHFAFADHYCTSRSHFICELENGLGEQVVG